LREETASGSNHGLDAKKKLGERKLQTSRPPLIKMGERVKAKVSTFNLLQRT
jgi:hypothetical protein